MVAGRCTVARESTKYVVMPAPMTAAPKKASVTMFSVWPLERSLAASVTCSPSLTATKSLSFQGEGPEEGPAKG